ncbi:WD repeat-containing protein 55 homolog [Bactrocera neohumeralis]|uniref:WD repeat-containing protein 55 homolog n=1 Tax=Bactrocera neohumeralis TaxID=98809 RepID=UPI00216591CF|nr:WD repeat-containing protein 55 homolog [Bactrocera neohumeralis]
MRMREIFKTPGENSESDELDELADVEDVEDAAVYEVHLEEPFESEDSEVEYGIANGSGNIANGQQSDAEDSDFDPNVDEDEDSSDFQPDDSDDSMSDTGNQEVIRKCKTNSGDDTGPGSSGVGRNNAGADVVSSALELNEDEEDDETVRAIIAAIKKPRTAPPEIKLDDFITDICFHPERDIIALATITGDVCLYAYSNEENTLLRNIEIHAKSCRDVEFTEDGRDLLTCSKDKSIMITDMETEKLKKFYESAHDEAINKLHIIDENLFSTGDDGGTVKLWDIRTKDSIFSLKEVEDFISQMLTNESKKLLLVTSGDGYLTTINIGSRKLFVQSEPYEEELHCMGTFRGNSKLVVGTSKGRLYTFNWGQFGYHCDMYPGINTPISEMIPITDRISCVAGEEGIIRACHIAPFRNLGVVGQHNMPIENLDVCNSGELIASSSHNNDVRFWNVKYFEDFGDIKYNEKHNTFKDKRHNLPSSKFTNAGDFFADLAKSPSDDNE